MRSDVGKFERDRQRTVTVTKYPKTTDFVDVINRVAAGGFDLTPFMTTGSHSANDATITMTWDSTGTFLPNQPQPGDILEIVENTIQLWVGVVEEINNFNEERGNRVVNILARSRDGVGPWRKRRYVSPRFQQGGTLAGAAQEVCKGQGLVANEYDIPLVGYTIPHTNVQFAEITPWQALRLIGQAIGYEPFTNARGQISMYNRDVSRIPDITLTNEDVVRIAGGKGKPSISAYQLKWLDRNLTKITQQDQVLGAEAITAGFFRLEQKRDVYWSDDRRARSQNTYMKVIQSINDSLLPIGDEEYEEIDRFHGTITITTDAWVPTLATISLAAMLALDYVPDGVIVGGFGASVGETIPFGRVYRGLAEAALLLIMMSLGVGSYEVWGQPFDFVHASNKTEAFDDAAPLWMEDVVSEDNDLIFDETHAQEVAIRELLHRIAETNRWDTVITDDPRIEPGDILELPDTSRLYVQEYTRNLTRGSDSTLSVSGFRS